MAEHDSQMQTGAAELQRVSRADTFGVFPSDGFATTVISSENDATLQLSFWIVDGTPDLEDITKLTPKDILY